MNEGGNDNHVHQEEENSEEHVEEQSSAQHSHNKKIGNKANDEELVLIHALLNPMLMTANYEQIRSSFFKAVKPRDPKNCEFYISESSGWISFVVKDELWVRSALPKLDPNKPGRKLIEKQAEEYLEKIATALLPPQLRLKDGLEEISVELLPKSKMTELVLVPRPDEGKDAIWDHWLYRAQPIIPLGKNKSAPVFGSQIELRIGVGGQLISFHSRWRPLSGEKISVLKSDMVASDDHSQADEHRHRQGAIKGKPPMMQYVFDGDTIPQYYLAPYYFVVNGHHFQISSASSFSLTVQVFRISQSKKDMDLAVVVEGGGGDYSFSWATYSLPGIDEPLKERGTTKMQNGFSTITLEAGQFIVLLNVRDNITGAFKHYQQQVFSSPSQLFLDESKPTSQEHLV